VKLKPGTTMAQAQSAIQPYMDGKAAMLIFPGGDDTKKMFDSYGKQPPHMPKKIGSREPKGYVPAILAKPDNFNQLWSAPEGTLVKLHADVTPWQTSHTWNVLGKFEGTDEKDQVILLSAHLDHLGVRNGTTYPGADDDASGTVAVLEFARALGQKPKLKRTVIFALWGSEEQGMVGSRYFLENPTFDLQQITANLEFEMIGRADAKVKPGQLWLTGWERTNLGPELAAHGAKLVGDPHPEQDFFERSDKIALARKGIVAQTVSSYGLHNDYHQPTDTVDKVDFPHMDQAIGSMIGPIVWLANSNFKPKWKAEEKP
jgi:Iap family predicted aminopeptidase